MPFVDQTTVAKNDAYGFQDINNLQNNDAYLKTQTEVLVAEDATVPKDNVIPEASLKVSNAPVEGAVLTARAGATGGMTWEGFWESADFISLS